MSSFTTSPMPNYDNQAEAYICPDCHEQIDRLHINRKRSEMHLADHYFLTFACACGNTMETNYLVDDGDPDPMHLKPGQFANQIKGSDSHDQA